MEHVGVRTNDAKIGMENLYAENKKIIDPISNRYFFVTDYKELDAQTVWFDERGTWPGGHLERIAPNNIKTPDDFTTGPVYVRYESTDKPSSFSTRAQICIWQDRFSRESCSEFVTFSEPGVYYVKLPPPADWWKKSPIDYTRAFHAFRLIHKEVEGGNRWVDTCGGGHCVGGSAAAHIPMSYEAEAILTTAGHAFAPPSDWTGCPADWGCGGAGTAQTQTDTTGETQDGTADASAASSCNLIGPGASVPNGFAAPYHVLSGAQELLVSVSCGAEGAHLSVGIGSDLQYIYNRAYVWQNSSWQQVALSGNDLQSGAWFVGQASAQLPQTQAELSQNNFVVAYVCTWTGQATGWKCGCRDAACVEGMWQLQAFRTGGAGGTAQVGDGGEEENEGGAAGGLTEEARERPRVLISTDAGRCDFDDIHTMIMTLLFADQLRIEGIIVSPPSCGWPNRIDDALDAYEEDYEDLAAQSSDFPTPQQLRSVYRASNGEDLIIEKAHEGSAGDPLWIGVWGSHTDVAEALREDPSIKPKIRLFGNELGWNYEQDRASRDYIWEEHPDLYWIEVLTSDLENNHLGDGLFRQHMNQSWYDEHVRGTGALGRLADVQYQSKPPCVNCESAFGPRDIGQAILYLLGNNVADPTEPGWEGVFEKYEDGEHENFWVYSNEAQYRTDGYDSRVPFAEGMEEWVPMLEERFGWLE